VERRLILDMLEQTAWNQTEAAERYQIPLSTLNQKIKRLGIDVHRKHPRATHASPPSAASALPVSSSPSSPSAPSNASPAAQASPPPIADPADSTDSSATK
jgi:hypothetical protein